MERDPLLVVITVLIGVVVVLQIPHAIFALRFLHGLCTRHEARWTELGKPTLIDTDRARSRRVRRFLRRGEFESLRDAELDAQIRKLRWLRLVLALAFWTAIILIFVSAFIGSR